MIIIIISYNYYYYMKQMNVKIKFAEKVNKTKYGISNNYSSDKSHKTGVLVTDVIVNGIQ